MSPPENLNSTLKLRIEADEVHYFSGRVESFVETTEEEQTNKEHVQKRNQFDEEFKLSVGFTVSVEIYEVCELVNAVFS